MYEAVRTTPRLARITLLASMAAAMGTGCFASHGLGGGGEPPPPPPPSGEPCGPTTCAATEVCCNESCGICTEPGVGCISLFCDDVDSGMPTADAGCEGEGLCPPELFCRSNDECSEDDYCLFDDSCGGAGTCTPRPTGCARNCPGVCACDGETYCNECEAAMVGFGVTSPRACDWEPPMGPCDFLSYCECTAQPGCEPLIDLRSGCVCNCEDPFNCTGIDCDCDCGGAEFIRCVRQGLCEEPTVDCGGDGIAGVGPSGCLECGPVDG